MRYIITGQKRLSGKIKVSGNKNSTFPCVAAALLTDEKVILTNIPNIKDVEVLMRILKSLGVSVNFENNVLTIQAKMLTSTLSKDLMAKLRGSLVLVGAIYGRLGKVSFHFPGGDVIGRRGIDVHLEGFKALGINVSFKDLTYSLQKGKKNIGECEFYQYITSVTATENLILASVLGPNSVTLKNCAYEPHVVDLCRMLTLMGAKIEGIGSDKLVINPVKKLKGVNYNIDMDHIEVGTYAIASALTGGEISLEGLSSTDLDPILKPLQMFGIEVQRGGNRADFFAKKLESNLKLQTNIWPGFPTDMMSALIVLATQSKGMTLCHDWIFESRMFFVDKLISMGANIIIADPHRVLVYGSSKLRGREIESPDIRAGMALVLAALTAQGQSIINRAELIERGYEDVVEKLKCLGAVIERSG